jgi:hypothetical protein
MRDSTGKWLSAADLIEILQQLPPGSRVYSNQLQQLSVTCESGDELIGLIDFNYGCFDSFEGDYEDDD